MEVSGKDYDSNRSPSVPASGTRTLRRNRPEGKSFFWEQRWQNRVGLSPKGGEMNE